MKFTPEEVWIERGEENSVIGRTVRARLDGVPIRDFAAPQAPPPVDFATGKRSLVLKRHRGGFLQHCPAGTSGMVCCNYLVVNFASNCPYDCSYCFLQDYLASNTRLTAFTNVDEALAEIDRALAGHPEKQFRIGTGELADSLALDPITGLSRQLVPFFAERDNAVLELKTKSDCIEELLRLDCRGRTVVSWSINPEVVGSDERGAAPIAARLGAAARVREHGYRVGFHLDPIVEHDGWERGYGRLLDDVFSAVEPDDVAWFSLGSLRMTASLQRQVRDRRGPAAAQVVQGAEVVRGRDGKFRVWQGLRVRMYRFLIERIRQRAPRVPVYLCMEPPAVWQRAMREVPTDRELGMRLAAGARW